MNNVKNVKKSSPMPAAKKAPAKPLNRADRTAPEFAMVRFELYAPRAREVFVAGSFNQWQLLPAASASSQQGKWARELSLAPGRYEYRFVVDGEWIPDPLAKDFVANPFGGQNSLVEVQASPSRRTRS